MMGWQICELPQLLISVPNHIPLQLGSVQNLLFTLIHNKVILACPKLSPVATDNNL